jgi:hypothetical protein
MAKWDKMTHVELFLRDDRPIIKSANDMKSKERPDIALGRSQNSDCSDVGKPSQ